MSEKLIQLVKEFMPDAEIIKAYQDETGQLKIDVKMGETVMSCYVKKSHTGDLYIE